MWNKWDNLIIATVPGTGQIQYILDIISAKINVVHIVLLYDLGEDI